MSTLRILKVLRPFSTPVTTTTTSSSSSCSSALVPSTLIKEWKKSILKHFSRNIVRFSHQIMCDIAAVNCGIKPSFLFDYGLVKPDQMLHFLHDLLQQGLLHTMSQPTIFLILSVGGDVLLCNCAALSNHLSRLLTQSAAVVAFTDISKVNKEPKLIEELDSLNGNLVDVLEKLLAFCQNEFENKKEEILFPSSLNLTTLVGILLGYPIVYWFSRSNQNEGNSLEINSLVVYKVMARIRMPQSCQFCNTLNKCAIHIDSNISSSKKCDKNSRDSTSNSGLETVSHAVYSFSVPENLALQVSNYIETWMDNLSVSSLWHQAFQTFHLEKKMVFAPATTL